MKSQLLGISLLGLLGGEASAIEPTEFDWETIKPSRDLKYSPCYGEYQCARLVVPLDWHDESNNHTVAIAITKLPAKVPASDPAFGGTIFTNPGGPGGSGVGFMLREGHLLQNTAAGKKQYEILSWDPRGVSFTSPNADCYLGDIATREAAILEESAMGGLDSGEDSLKKRLTWTQAVGKLCAQGAVNGSILPFATTPYVVRDMVEILDKVHELRDEELRHSAAAGINEDAGSEKVLELREKQVPRILYWGFSYGSILGNTFASMYPGRVGRLIIDGIADPNDYMKGTWLTNLQDTEELLDEFYKTCFEAGDKCALYQSSVKKWQDIKKRVEDFISQTEQQPFSILEDKKIRIITGHEIRYSIIRPLYQPLKMFQRLATLLSDTLEGNYTLLLQDLDVELPALRDSCTSLNSSAAAILGGRDASMAIKCADGEDDTTAGGPAYWAAYVRELQAQSPTLGPYWAQIRFRCSGYGVRSGWRFTGPFTTPPHDTALVPGRPAAPLLFFSARLDPVTPLRNAVAAAARHPGASWVVQESLGHCASATPSDCSAKILREYLESGTVPESGTVCPADCDPWHPCDADSLSASFQSVAEYALPGRLLG